MDSLAEIENSLEGLGIPEALRLFTNLFPNQVVFSTSMGQEAQVLADIIFANRLPVRVFTIDTGRLFAETLELIKATEQKYNCCIEVIRPDTEQVNQLVKERGVDCFYNSIDNRRECCRVRKLLPMAHAMKHMKVWVTGMRTAQSEYRSKLKKISWNATYGVIKFNPLVGWSLEEINQYLIANNVPFNKLHAKGYISIGCEPCTKSVEQGDTIRSGRWWWEKSEKECGLNL